VADRPADQQGDPLQAIAQGRSTKEVAESLFISQLTVQTHVKNILGKLGVHSKLEAVTFALRHDLIGIGASV
jgi:DNA-binding NarL/FixJ family response regulator